MKKLIAIAVVFALAVGAAFAADIGASVNGKVVFAQGETDKDVTTGWEAGGRISASGQNENGTFGGEFRFDFGGWNGYVGAGFDLDKLGAGDMSGISGNARANVWWKPIEQLKVQINSGLDGSWGSGDNLGWGFYEGANDVVAEYDSGAGGGTPNFDGTGLLLEITPISGLGINLGIPFGRYNDNITDLFMHTVAEVNYNIANIGKITVGFAGGLNKMNGTELDTSHVGVGFSLTAVENLGVYLYAGFGFPLTETYEVTAGKNQTNTYYDATNIALSASYSMGAFGIKFRFAGALGIGSGKTEYDGTTTERKGISNILFGLYPKYQINEQLMAGLGFDMGMNGIAENVDPTVVWHVSPHLIYNVGGGGTFKFGINFGGSKPPVGDPTVKWSIPIHMSFDL